MASNDKKGIFILKLILMLIFSVALFFIGKWSIGYFEITSWWGKILLCIGIGGSSGIGVLTTKGILQAPGAGVSTLGGIAHNIGDNARLAKFGGIGAAAGGIVGIILCLTPTEGIAGVVKSVLVFAIIGAIVTPLIGGAAAKIAGDDFLHNAGLNAVDGKRMSIGAGIGAIVGAIVGICKYVL